MYLDTDIILALVKKEDWLKKHVDLSKLKPATTSTFTVIEARVVLEREYSRTEALAVVAAIQRLKVELLPLTETVLKKSQELLEQYPRLNNFDAVHVAFAIIHNDTIVSTDTIFPTIAGLHCRDPRTI